MNRDKTLLGARKYYIEVEGRGFVNIDMPKGSIQTIIFSDTSEEVLEEEKVSLSSYVSNLLESAIQGREDSKRRTLLLPIFVGIAGVLSLVATAVGALKKRKLRAAPEDIDYEYRTV